MTESVPPSPHPILTALHPPLLVGTTHELEPGNLHIMRLSTCLLFMSSLATSIHLHHMDQQAPILAAMHQGTPIAQPPDTSLYFGYGSNLWLHQMDVRCPDSTYLGVARLPGYKWIIYSRGYANIVQTAKGGQSNQVALLEPKSHDDEVYALVYSLTPSDEARLDRNEGVPVAYQKEFLDVQFWPTDARNPAVKINVTDDTTRQDIKALVYINRLEAGKEEGVIKEEYIYRMNKGIDDAIARGVPEGYVKRVLRKWVPEKADRGVEEVAQQQALEFNNEY